jgi:predicted dehydrogenase
MKGTTRRSFLRRSVTVSAAGFVAVNLGYAPWAKAAGANDDIRLAMVGLGSKVKNGGRGRLDMREFQKLPGVRIVALCDVDAANLGPVIEDCQRRNEQVAVYSDVRKLLENQEIDAVSIATPNHWHALATIWACMAGKDVFVQKPASHNIYEGRKMVEAAAKHNRIVLSASGSREPTGYQEALDYIGQGHLGKTVLIRGVTFRPRTSIGKVSGPQKVPSTVDYDLWSGPAPVAPLTRQNLHYDWHWNRLYGNGELGNLSIHDLDGCRMAAGDRLPRHVISLGGRFGYVDDGETPNTQIVYFDYEPAPILFEIRGLPKDKSFHKNALPNRDSWGKDAMDAHEGISVGKVIRCENGYVVTSKNESKAFDNNGRLIHEFKPTTPDLYANFIQAMRSRRPSELAADILQGHLSAALVHMGNLSQYLGRAMSDGEIRERLDGSKELAACYERLKTHLSANGVDLDRTPITMGTPLTMDPDTERFVSDDGAAANELISREYRIPFVVPENV